MRSFSGSAKQNQVLDQTGLTRSQLSSLFALDGSPDRTRLANLLHALKSFSKPVKPLDLGLIGKGHLLACFNELGVEPETFKYEMEDVE